MLGHEVAVSREEALLALALIARGCRSLTRSLAPSFSHSHSLTATLRVTEALLWRGTDPRAFELRPHAVPILGAIFGMIQSQS